MKNITELEIIQINTNEDGEMKAVLSYRDDRVADLNNGYSIISVPVVPRKILLSERGNWLVNQSKGNAEERDTAVSGN